MVTMKQWKQFFLILGVTAGCVAVSETAAFYTVRFFHLSDSKFIFMMAFWEPVLAAPAIVVAYIILSDYLQRKNQELQGLSAELFQSLKKAEEMRSLMPICPACKKVRNDQGYWDKVESFVAKHSGATFSHSICPECLKKQMDEIDQEG